MSKLIRTALVFVFLCLHAQSAFSYPVSNSDVVKDLKTFCELRDDEVDTRVDLEATVTFIDPIWSFIFVQDGNFAVYVDYVYDKDLNAGDRIRIEGTGQIGDLNPIILCEKITRLGSGQLPIPIPIDLSSIKVGQHDSVYISSKGTILRAVSSVGHTLYFCESEGVSFHVSVVGSRSLSELWSMIGAEIKVVGALAVTLKAGTEDYGTMAGPRPIETLRVVCTQEPEVVSLAQTDETAEANLFHIDGQVLFDFGDSFVLAGSKSHQIDFPGIHGFGIENIVRVTGTKIDDGRANSKLNALAVEAMYSTRLPVPEQFQQVAAEQRKFRYVTVSGKPKNIRKYGERIRFDVIQDGQTANVVLMKDASQCLSLLRNTNLIEVKGVVTECQANGNCDVVIQNSNYVSFVETYIPIWKYATWILLPLTALFSIGFIWVRIQRNRDVIAAASINTMHTRLVSTYQAIDDGLLAIDNNDRVLSVNTEFCKLVGVDLSPGDEFNQATCEKFLRRLKNSEQVQNFIFNRDLVNQKSARIEVEVCTPEHALFDLNLTAIVCEDETTIGRLLILRDHTLENQLQAELIHSNKIEAVGKLVGGVAHDFNNILTAITANLSLLSLDSQIKKIDLERVSDAEVAAERGTQLVRRLLSYSGKSELNPQSHSINAIIREHYKFTRATFDARYQFRFEFDETEPFVLVDAGAIEQVILNLYLNARDSMPNGGVITTKTKLVSSQDTHVCLWITDNGPGIDAVIQPQIFDPFFTTKAGEAGTGLGLSTSRRLIHEQNGELALVPLQVRGTSFLIQLPKTQPIDRPEEPAPPNQLKVHTSKTILVVDDEDTIRKISAAILELHGFEVLTAVNGNAALGVLETEHDRIDLMLLDLTMPGISGLDVLEVVSADYPDIAVILCSGYLAAVPDRYSADCLQLSKPFSTQVLIATICDALKLETTPAAND